MSFVMQCPFCAKQVSVPDDANEVRCPKCRKKFTFADSEDDIGSSVPDDESSSDSVLAGPGADDAETESVLLPWISPWGVAAFSLGAVAFGLAALSSLAPSIGGVRYLTIALGAAGAVLTLIGIPATGEQRETKDKVWLTLAGIVSTTVFSLALLSPQILNPRWAMEFNVPEADPNKMVVVPRNQPLDPGKALAPDSWVDATTQAIRQGDVIIALESVKRGSVSDKEIEPRLLVHFRIGSSGHERKLTFIGFENDNRRPKLTDDTGHSYAFIEQRARKLRAGPPWIWLAGPPRAVDVLPSRAQEFLLIFEATPAKFIPLQLELPASAWGRQGVGRLRITDYIEQKMYEQIMPPAPEK